MLFLVHNVAGRSHTKAARRAASVHSSKMFLEGVRVPMGRYRTLSLVQLKKLAPKLAELCLAGVAEVTTQDRRKLDPEALAKGQIVVGEPIKFSPPRKPFLDTIEAVDTHGGIDIPPTPEGSTAADVAAEEAALEAELAEEAALAAALDEPVPETAPEVATEEAPEEATGGIGAMLADMDEEEEVVEETEPSTSTAAAPHKAEPKKGGRGKRK